MTNVPELRFVGFDEEWDSRRLKSLIKDIGTGSSKFNFIEGRYPVLGSTGIIGYDNQFDYDGKFILIARVGANAGILYKYNGKVKISDNTIFITTKNQEYIYNLLLKKDLTRLVFGSGQPLVKSSDLKDLHVIYTKNEEEQDKIGSLFKKFDELIEIQEGKVTKMEDFKKSMLQKMFPKKDELVPEFRFYGFDGVWEKKKISDIGKITAGGDVDKKKISNKGRYPVIANGDSNNGIIGYYEDYYKISEPAVTVSARGNIGTAVARNYPFTPVIRVLTLTSDNNIYFMSEAINRLRIFNESSGVPQLTSPQFGGYNIFMAKLSEQEKIGQFFKNIDTQIENEEKLLESYKMMKKSLLQKMFV